MKWEKEPILHPGVSAEEYGREVLIDAIKMWIWCQEYNELIEA